MSAEAIEVRRVVLVGHDNEGSRDIFSAVAERHRDLDMMLVIAQGLYYRRSTLSSMVKLVREASWMFCARRLLDLIGYRLRRDTLERRARALGVPIVFSHDVNDDETVRAMQDFAPDLLVSLFTMHLYRRPSLEVPRVAAIGSHPSILPSYRGLEVFFWMMADGVRDAGVSVFRLTSKVDAGDVLLQRPFTIEDDDTVVSVYAKLTALTGRLVADAIQRFRDGSPFDAVEPATEASYFPMPTRDAWRRFRKRGKRWA